MLADFSSIIGHGRLLGVLSRMKEAETLPHAILIVGQHSLGKTTIAESLILSLYKDAQSLTQIPDAIVVERDIDEKTGKKKTQISVKQIRALSERLAMSSLGGGWKSVFIEEADTLSIGAANALLKTLEEPRGKTLMILRASSVDRVPATIASRCQVFRCSVVPIKEIADALEKRGMSKTEAQEIAAMSQGRPGMALRYLKETEFRAERDLATSSCLRLFESSFPEQMALSGQLLPKDEVNKQERLHRLLSGWQTVLRDILFLQLSDALPISSQKDSDALASLAHRMDQKEVVEKLKRIQQTKRAISHNINSQLGLEHVLMA